MFIMRLALFFSFILVSFQAYPQNRGNIWCFGDSAGIDFNQTLPSPIRSMVKTRGSTSSISDSLGNLLFYVATNSGTIGNTAKIWCSDNSIMQKGDSIVGQGWFNEESIAPNPLNNNTYYLFSIGVTTSGPTGFFYSLIDMNLNGGLGAVVQKNIQLQPFKIDDEVSLIKHGNGRDWWVFFRSNFSPNDTIYSYLISVNGISNLIWQKINSINNGHAKRIVFTNDGKHAVLTNFGGLIEFVDFDRCTGLFSNSINISNELETPSLFGVAISPNDSKLYISTDSNSPDTCYIFQYDLNATDIRGSKDTIYTYSFPPSYYEVGLLELAPNGKIYVANQYQNGVNVPFPYQDSMYNYINMNLSVINDPDQLGSACNFQSYSFYLGGARAYWGLPNNPNYDLPALQNSICDTITTVNSVEQTKPKLNVFYHTDWKKLFVNASGLKDGEYHLAIYTIDGKLIFSSPTSSLSGFLTKDIAAEGFSSGTYIVVLENGKVKLTEKFIAN